LLVHICSPNRYAKASFDIYLVMSCAIANSQLLVYICSSDFKRMFSLFAAACCGCNPAAAAASTVFFSLWIAAAAVQTAATVSACSQPNTPVVCYYGDRRLFSAHSVFCTVDYILREISLNMSKSISKFLGSLMLSESINI
jgi:hypothetical protein